MFLNYDIFVLVRNYLLRWIFFFMVRLIVIAHNNIVKGRLHFEKL